jgi:hypothetical protein
MGSQAGGGRKTQWRSVVCCTQGVCVWHVQMVGAECAPAVEGVAGVHGMWEGHAAGRAG